MQTGYIIRCVDFVSWVLGIERPVTKYKINPVDTRVLDVSQTD
jgi:hypothetical protein